MFLDRLRAILGRYLTASTIAAVAVALLFTMAIGLRFGYEPNAGSHRVQIEYDGPFDADETVEPAASFQLAPTLGQFAPPQEFTLDGWRSDGDGSFVATEDGATSTFSGQMDAISHLFWSISDPDGALTLTINGGERAVLSGTDRAGVESIELPLRTPSAFLPLLLAIGALLAAVAPWVITQLSDAVVQHGPRRVLQGGTACLVGGVFTIALWPVPAAPLVTYDIEVTNRSSEEAVGPLTVRLREPDGSAGWTISDSTVPGWTATEAGMFSDTVGQALRVVLVASPASRLDFFGSTDTTGDVTVNGRLTTVRPIERNGVVSPKLDELSGPLDRGASTLLYASRVADVLLLAGAFGLVLLCVRRAGGRRTAARDPGAGSVVQVASRRKRILSYALVPGAVWSCVLATFWPGIMTPDSLWQWRQLDSGNLSDWHPYTMTVIVGLFRKLYGSPWVSILVVLVAAALLVGAIAALAERRGCPPRVVRLMTVGVTLCPPILLMTAVLWKDVVMGVATLALVLATWLLLERQPARLRDQPALFTLLIGSGLAMWLSRHNSWPVVVTTLVIIALARRQIRTPMLSAVAAICVVGVIVTGPVAGLMDVKPSPVGSIVLVQRISAHVNAGTRLEPDEVRLLESIRPLDEPWPYDCGSVFPTISSSGIPVDAYSDKESELRNLVIRLAIRAPQVEIRHVACSSRIVWQVSERGTRTGFVNLARRGDIVDSISRGRLDAPLEQPASRRLAAGTFDTIDGLPSPVLRPALYTYALAAAAVLACRRRRSLDPFLITLPAFMQTLVLTPVVLVPDTRFQYGVILVAMVMTPLLVTASSHTSQSSPPLSWTRSPEP